MKTMIKMLIILFSLNHCYKNIKQYPHLVKLAKMTKPELYHDMWLPSTCFKNQSLTFHDHTSTFISINHITARTHACTDSSKTKDIGLRMDTRCYIHQFQFYPFSTFIQHMSFKPNSIKKSDSLLCKNKIPNALSLVTFSHMSYSQPIFVQNQIFTLSKGKAIPFFISS